MYLFLCILKCLNLKKKFLILNIFCFLVGFYINIWMFYFEDIWVLVKEIFFLVFVVMFFYKIVVC